MNAIILAGGKSSRFGQNKAFIRFGDQPLIEKIASVLAPLFNKIYIVTNNPADYQHLKAELVMDIFPGCGPLGGIHAGLTASDSQLNFVVGCDMPGLDPALILRLRQGPNNRWANSCWEAEGFDLIVPAVQGKLQMLFAFYSRNCLPIIEEQLHQKNLRLRELVEKVNSKVIEFKSHERSFLNINTADDYRKAVALVN